jgi:eukaryotic-like serine/threonine-protein kinase
VLDFGIVSQQNNPSMTPITMAGMIVGTPAFLAPELTGGEGAFDARADLYSLGCIAYWLVTGRPPFEGDDAVSLLRQHFEATPSPPSAFTTGAIPRAFDEIVLACLSKDPGLRPPNADILYQRLDEVALPSAWDNQRARGWWEQHEASLVAAD